MSCGGYRNIKGNWCQSCCPDCESRVPPFMRPYVKCCKTVSGNKCYNYLECKQCVNDTDPNNTEFRKVVDVCNDENHPESGKNPYREAGQTSCCAGECYDSRCYDCDGHKLIPKFDGISSACCKGAGIYYMSDCQECIQDTSPRGMDFGLFKIIEGCSEPGGSGYSANKKQCCSGKPSTMSNGNVITQGCAGMCYNNSCDTCYNQSCPITVSKKCPDGDDKTLTACCGGKCWDPANECQECVQKPNGEEELRDKPRNECLKCCGKKCCTTKKPDCCGTEDDGECYDPKCSECKEE